MTKKYSSQKSSNKIGLAFPLVIIFLLSGPGWSGALAAGGDFSADETNQLKAVEEKLFVRTYDDDKDDARMARIEKRIFGDAESGDLHQRLQKAVAVSKPFDKPKNTAPKTTEHRAPAPRGPSPEEERLRQEDAREQARVRAMAAAAEEVNQLLAEAVSLYKSGRGNEAIDKFQQVVRLAPDNAEAYFSLGVIYEAQHHYNEALASYKRAADLNPQKSDYKEALAIVAKKARTDQSNDPQKAELKAMANEAAQAYSRGEYFSALDLYKQLEVKAPKEAQVKYNIGTIYLALKNPVQALEYFQFAYKLKPDEPRFKEACDRLGANLKHSETARLSQEQAWQHPGKTTINFVPSTAGGGNNNNNNNGNGNSNNSSNAKMPPVATSLGLVLRKHKDGIEIATVGIASRAAGAGLLKGDVIKAVDGVVIESMDQLNQILTSKGNSQMQLLIQRGPKIGQVVF